MTSVRVDFGALREGAARLGQAGGSFGHGSGQVGMAPGAAAPGWSVDGPLDDASGLLDRVLVAITDSLRKAASELDDIAGGLGDTAAAYESAERVLASWHVPGGM